jgi:hypothetical protein
MWVTLRDVRLSAIHEGFNSEATGSSGTDYVHRSFCYHSKVCPRRPCSPPLLKVRIHQVNLCRRCCAIQRLSAVLQADVLMDEILRMNVLEWVNDLVCQHQHPLQRKKSAAVIEEIFEAWTKELEHHYSVFAFSPKPVDLGNPSPASERLVNL